MNTDYIIRFLKPWIDLPTGARVPLPFMEYYTMNIPISLRIIEIILPVFKIVTVLSFVGLFTNVVLLIYTFLAFYIYSIPELFGHPFNLHFLLWFPAILCFSDCSSVLSLDSIIQKKIFNSKIILTKSPQYGIPLKIGILLIGIIYFFPGFWKIWSCGLDWIFEANVRNLMYSYWNELNGWKPALRFDKSEILMIAASAITVLFELSFIFFSFRPKLRPWLAITGFGFHFLIFFFMGINFMYLTVCYVFLIDWSSFYKARSHAFPNAPINTLPHYFTQNKASSIFFFILIGGNILFGTLKIVSWPFACFPTFDNMIPSTGQFVYYKGFLNEKEVLNDKQIRTLLQRDLNIHEVAACESQIVNGYNNHSLTEINKEARVLMHTISIKKQLDSIQIWIVASGISPESRKKFKPIEMLCSERIPK